jgi:hypothetical protein
MPVRNVGAPAETGLSTSRIQESQLARFQGSRHGQQIPPKRRHLSTELYHKTVALRRCQSFFHKHDSYWSRYGDGLRAGWPGFDSRQCNISLFSTASRPALGPTQPPIQWVPGVKLQGRETDHSPSSSGDIPPISPQGIVLN